LKSWSDPIHVDVGSWLSLHTKLISEVRGFSRHATKPTSL
jgi:hypothetical protein